MKVILFGATGMVGQGVRRECLFDFGAAGADLQGYDACFFCLGVSSASMSEGATAVATTASGAIEVLGEYASRAKLRGRGRGPSLPRGAADAAKSTKLTRSCVPSTKAR